MNLSEDKPFGLNHGHEKLNKAHAMYDSTPVSNERNEWSENAVYNYPGHYTQHHCGCCHCGCPCRGWNPYAPGFKDWWGTSVNTNANPNPNPTTLS